jgi:hypothetical protein
MKQLAYLARVNANAGQEYWLIDTIKKSHVIYASAYELACVEYANKNNIRIIKNKERKK